MSRQDKHYSGVVLLMSYLPQERNRAKGAKLENINTDSENEAIVRFLPDCNIVVLELNDEDFISMINRYRSARNQLLPTFTFLPEGTLV